MLLNCEISYFIGVLHSDGCIYNFYDKKDKFIRHRFSIGVEEKSLPMVEKVQKIMKEQFKRNVKILSRGKNEYGNNCFYLQTGINRLLPRFSLLEINKNFLPKTIMHNKKLFCAYLAGLIDGDGTICIKRPKYPQCNIRIASEKNSKYLKILIEKFLNCKCWINKVIVDSLMGKPLRKVHGSCFNYNFYLSSKNLKDFKDNVYPFIQIKHKKNIIEKFFRMKELSYGPIKKLFLSS